MRSRLSRLSEPFMPGGIWSEEAVALKLGIVQKYVPGEDDGTQEMGVRAAKACLENTGVDPKDIDVILCIGEEWKGQKGSAAKT